MTGVSGVMAAEADWEVAGIALATGTNTIAVNGTNALGVMAGDRVSIERREVQPGELEPFVDITNDTMILEIAQPFIAAGTNNAHVAGMMWISNAAGGASASFTAMAAWVSAPVPLALQTNLIFVFGSNLVGQVTNDTVEIVGVPEPVAAGATGVIACWLLLVWRRR